MAQSKMAIPIFPTITTMTRTSCVRSALKRTFVEAYHHLSQLRGRSIDEYCLQEKRKGYVSNVFTSKEKELLNSQEVHFSVENFEKLKTKLVYKLLRYVCGLAPREDEIWKIDADTIEYLIFQTYDEFKALNEASAFSDNSLNDRLKKLVDCLIRILSKVENLKDVDLSSVKKEVSDSLIFQFCLADNSISPRMLNQQVIHRVFALAYKQLNTLEGENAYSFLKSKYENMKAFTLKEKQLLEKDSTTVANMSIGLIYKLLPRMCVLLEIKKWSTSQGTMEHSLHCLKQEHDAITAMDNQAQVDFHEIYKHLENVINKIAEKTNKSMPKIMMQMQDEPQCLDHSFHILPTFSKDSSNSPLLRSQPDDVNLCSDSRHLSEASAQEDQDVNLSKLSLCERDPESQNPLSVEEENIARLFKVLCAGGVAARTLAKVFVALSGNINKLDSTTRKKIFTTRELNSLKNRVTFDDLDISLLAKLLRTSCGLSPPSDDVWHTEGDTLEYCLTCIKKERNELAHDRTSITTHELETKLQALENWLENVLTKTNEIKSSVDLQEHKAKMKDELQKISMSYNPHDYCKSVKEMKEILSCKLAVDAKKELQKSYAKVIQNLCPVNWIHHEQHDSISIDKVYMELDFVDAYDTSACNTSLKNLFSPQEGQKSNSRVVAIQGESGVGKSSMCKYMVHLWTSNDEHSNLKDTDLLLYIQCRYVTSTSLLSYLKSSLHKALHGIADNDIIPMLLDLRIMLVVDGYDEALTEAKHLIEEALNSLPESRMIITSKPQWIPKLKTKIKQVTSCFRLLSVNGFNKDKREQYIGKYFGAILGRDAKDQCDAFLKYLSELDDQLEALTRLPLTLALLALLWLQDSKKAKEPKTIAQLYKKLTDFILKIHGCKENVDDHESLCDWLLSLGKVAWDNLKKNQHHLSDKDVQKLKNISRKLKVNGTKLLASLMHCHTETTLTDCINVWSFTHNCQQEFLAATYITDIMKNGDEPLSKILGFNTGNDKNRKLQRLLQVIEFISDLLHHNEDMDETKSRQIAITTLMVQTPWSFAAARRISRHLLPGSFQDIFSEQQLGDFLEGYDPENLLWILENTSLAVPSSINIRSSIDTVDRMSRLLRLLAEKSCQTNVIILIVSIANISKIIRVIEENKAEPVSFALMTWNPYTLASLVKEWPWPQALRLHMPEDVFPLLWWELEVSLTKAGQSAVNVHHGLASPHSVTLIQTGLQRMGAQAHIDPNLPAPHLVIVPAKDLKPQSHEQVDQ